MKGGMTGQKYSWKVLKVSMASVQGFWSESWIGGLDPPLINYIFPFDFIFLNLGN